MVRAPRLVILPVIIAGLITSCSGYSIDSVPTTLPASPLPAPSLTPVSREPTPNVAVPTAASVVTRALQSFGLVSILKGDAKQLNTPTGIATDKQGNLFVMDAGNYRVVKFNSEGHVLTTWGERGEADGQFIVAPHADYVAADLQGNVYVADSSYRVQKFDNDGKFLTRWGSKGEGEGQFSSNIMSVAVDMQGNVYIAQRFDHSVAKLDSAGKLLLRWGGKGTGESELFEPVGLCIDQAGNIYVAEYQNGRIQEFDSNGKPQNKFFIPQVADKVVTPGAMAVDAQDSLYVTDVANNRIVKLDHTGDVLGVWGKPGTGNGEFDEPWGVTVDAGGNIYISDSINGRVQKYRAN